MSLTVINGNLSTTTGSSQTFAGSSSNSITEFNTVQSLQAFEPTVSAQMNNAGAYNQAYSSNENLSNYSPNGFIYVFIITMLMLIMFTLFFGVK